MLNLRSIVWKVSFIEIGCFYEIRQLKTITYSSALNNTALPHAQLKKQNMSP